MNTRLISGQDLAYFGDAVVELLARERMIREGIVGVKELNREAMRYVRATAQSAALDNILPLLTEDEMAVFKRGRNNHVGAIPKSASAVEYRRATGFEALFAHLWLSGEEERARELFAIAYPTKTES
ncbi:MAG: ribonuclease III [Clostridia bacterium]|nr:ribonuclease III [Clostridia bacterium]